jgi:predicted HicB family RNase H-like nuclease
MKRLNVDLPEAVHRELKLVAMHQDISISALVNSLLVDYLQTLAEKAGQPRRRTSDWPGHLNGLDRPDQAP